MQQRMSPRRQVLLIESDPNAVAQMRRVLAVMKMRAFAASDEDSRHELVESLVRDGRQIDLIVARVSLPSGSGIRMLEETAGQFPRAQQLLISHHPRALLLSATPGFADHAANFLQAEFTDQQFQQAVEQALAKGLAAR